MALNDKQRRFVEEYLIDLNATQAAIRAGYSAKTAQEQGARLLSNVMVKKAIEIGLKTKEKQSERKAADVLRDIQRVSSKAMTQLDEEFSAAAVNGALKALELEGKHLGMFTDKHEVTGKNGAPLTQRVVIPENATPEQIRAMMAALIKVNEDGYNV